MIRNKKNQRGMLLLLLTLSVWLLFPATWGYAEPQEAAELPAASSSMEEKDMGLASKSYILVDCTSGKTLVSFHADEVRPPASMTKLMTLLLTVEDIEAGKVTLDDIVTTSETANHMGGSQIYLEVGEQMPLRDMMLALAVESANDACAAIAEYLSEDGTIGSFVSRMNQRAQELGMTKTKFINCTGLPDAGHVSTAYDISRLALEAVKHPQLLEYTSLQEATIRGGEKQMKSTNKLLSQYEGVDGLKTGWTTEAGNCLAATAMRDGLRLVSVVMGGEKTDSQFTDSVTLLDDGFTRYAYHGYFLKNDVCSSIRVGEGTVDELKLVAAEDVGVSYVKEQEDTLSYSVMIPSTFVEAPIAKGAKLGAIDIFVAGECQKTIDLVAAEGVERGGFLRQCLKLFKSVTTY